MIYQRIKKLADLNEVSIYRVERDSGLSNGAISKWGRTANQTPICRKQIISDFVLIIRIK